MKKQMLTLCLGLSLALPAFTANDESSDLLEDLSGLELESSEGLQAEMDIEELMHPSPKKVLKEKNRNKAKIIIEISGADILENTEKQECIV
ncbi:MAG: hypothetical protein VX642_14295 [Bdellovibrionota bacterium]|nr:hypothetical protein [Bdellovibrionota bacterium]